MRMEIQLAPDFPKGIEESHWGAMERERTKSLDSEIASEREAIADLQKKVEALIKRRDEEKAKQKIREDLEALQREIKTVKSTQENQGGRDAE